jgi:hypothetical protein
MMGVTTVSTLMGCLREWGFYDGRLMKSTLGSGLRARRYDRCIYFQNGIGKWTFSKGDLYMGDWA